MKEIDVSQITETIAELCIKANCVIAPDIKEAFLKARDVEEDSMSKQVMGILIENSEIAKEEMIPICQDTGMTVVFVEMGQDVKIVGGSITDAINEGVRKGYTDGFLRKSVVEDPLRRKNTGDNTPAIIHYNIVEGDKLKITVSPKGFGSENMSALKMLTPSQGIEGVKEVIIETVKKAGPNPCPPIIVGVGIGGTMEKSALLAKQGLLRKVGTVNEDEYLAELEKELLETINNLNIGPSGLGGKTTALAVHINTHATHIAGLPVAVNIGCHATRHEEIIL